MIETAKDLWELVKYRPQIDAEDLAEAVDAQAGEGPLDYRTRLLIRDSVSGLRNYWGDQRVAEWLNHASHREQIESICHEEFERPGFPTIGRRLVKKVDPEDIKTLLRELSVNVRRRTRIHVGGSVALLIPKLLSRETDDIDIVDEVPEAIRTQYDLLDRLKERYGLKVGHFQSHYLPMRWEQRVHYLDTYGELQVYLLDPTDVFMSKLFSIREKDLDDMRELRKLLDKETLIDRLKNDCVSTLAAASLRERAEKNWFILYGEPLPT